MKSRLCIAIACAVACVTSVRNSRAQEPPAGANAPPIPITSHDRVCHADESFNTVGGRTSNAVGCRTLIRDL